MGYLEGQLFAASYACCIPSKWVALRWFWPRYWPQMFATVLFSALFVATCCYFGAIFVSHGFEGTWFGFALHAAKCIQALACAKGCAFRHQWLQQCPCDFEDALTRFCHFPQILLAMRPSTKTIWGKRTKITKPTSLTRYDGTMVTKINWRSSRPVDAWTIWVTIKSIGQARVI